MADPPCSDYWERFDVPDLLSLLLSLALRGAEMYLVGMNPLYVPPNDSLSKYPVRADTVPADFLHTLVLVVLASTVALLFFFHRFFPYWFRPINAFAAVWVWGAQACLVELLTDLFKNFVGRARPCLYAVCGADAQFETCDPAVPLADRTGLFQSWPSGHSTTAMQGFLFAALLWKKGVVSTVSWVSTGAVALCSAALFVGATRIKDYKHHADDVLAGFLIAALVCGVVWYRGHRRIFPKAARAARIV
jgi:phosphatidate phosphatase